MEKEFRIVSRYYWESNADHPFLEGNKQSRAVFFVIIKFGEDTRKIYEEVKKIFI